MKECPISEKFRNSASFAIPLNGERVFYTDKKKGSVAIRCIDKINDTTKGQFYNYLNKRISNLPRILAIQESLFYQQCSPSHPRAFERIIDSTGKDVTCGKTKKPREATPEYYLERLKNCEGATLLKATAEKAKATIDGKPSASTQETTNSQTLSVR